MNTREALINGLRHRGWHHWTTGYRRTAKWEAYRHPDKANRTLWVTPMAKLHVGETVHSCEPVQPSFIELIINLGRQEVR